MLTKNEAAKKAKIRKKLRLGSDFVYRYLGRKKNLSLKRLDPDQYSEFGLGSRKPSNTGFNTNLMYNPLFFVWLWIVSVLHDLMDPGQDLRIRILPTIFSLIWSTLVHFWIRNKPNNCWRETLSNYKHIGVPYCWISLFFTIVFLFFHFLRPKKKKKTSLENGGESNTFMQPNEIEIIFKTHASVTPELGKGLVPVSGAGGGGGHPKFFYVL